jgi:hypothetical protein
MKRICMVVALVSSMLLGSGGAAKAAEAEAIFFQVKCVLPSFPTAGDLTTCSGGLGDPGIGSSFIGPANPAASLDNVYYDTPDCVVLRASGGFTIHGISADFTLSQRGALGEIDLIRVNGGGFTNGIGIGSTEIAPTTLADAKKAANGCLGTPQIYVGITITGTVTLVDLG